MIGYPIGAENAFRNLYNHILTVPEIARRSSMRNHTAVLIMHKAIEDGLVRRWPNSRNKLTLTLTGRKLVRRLYPWIVDAKWGIDDPTGNDRSPKPAA